MTTNGTHEHSSKCGLTSALRCAHSVLAFGFYDAVRLSTILGMFPQYDDNIQMANFYPKKHRIGVGKDQVDTNVAATLVAIMLLAAAMKKGSEQTLLAGNPIDNILYQDLTAAAKKQPLLLLWRVLAAVFLQLCWGVHTLFVPTLAGMGAAMAFANESNTQDIVLNAVASA